MNQQRPDPDELLSRMTREAETAQRGKLKIFFGSNAGVGKTYAMLDEARKRAAEGLDVVVGYAEQHIRPETEALLLGLEILPHLTVEYRGAKLKEFDLDAALARRPTICCVDELAHSNPDGLRHAKRWQDVQELLDAGINVYATLNVQHLESLNDIVASITGVRVRETLPDRVFEEADQVELLDISPEELSERLREGKVYRPDQAQQALKHFFNAGNLIALRELALRKTAERVDAQMQVARHATASPHPWAASERILVCVGPSPFSLQLVRATKRLATALRAPWIAAYVETPRALRMPPEAQQRLRQTLRLTEELGGATVTLSGPRVAEELLTYARQKNITKIVIGKPELSRWREWWFGSIVDELIRHSGQIDIYVIRDETPPADKPVFTRAQITRQHWEGYIWAIGVTAVNALLGAVLYHKLHISNANIAMLYLLGVLLVSARFSRSVGALTALLGVAAFDVTVVPPYGSLAVTDSQYLITFGVMLVTALLISTLTDRIRQQAISARSRERQTAALLSLSRELAAIRELDALLQAILRHVTEVFNSPAIVFMANNDQHLVPTQSGAAGESLDAKELAVAQWVYDNAQTAGSGTSTLPAVQGLYLPLNATGGTVGVLGLLTPVAVHDPERFHLLEAFASQAALAIQRALLANESSKAWQLVEAEFLRNTLLSGVSHDLRTPLAGITGAASSLLDTPGLSEADRQELTENIATEAERMERIINNLLDMTRLEAGGLQLNKDWNAIDELVGTALASTHKRLRNHPVTTHITPNLPLIFVDAIALEQVLINILDNAVNYTPPGTTIAISVQILNERVVLQVADTGPGLPAGDTQSVFQKFYRGQANGAIPAHTSRRGVGLGLAICKGLIELHGGTITASNRPASQGGGAVFRIELPVGGIAPAPPDEEPEEPES